MGKKNVKKLGQFEIPELRNASKTLLANIRFASVDEPVRSIVVTSTTPDEGKTATATNLACAIASAGHTVLVVDCDMRRRCIGSMLGIHPRYGLYAVLSGEAKISEAVTPTPYKNLFFLDCEPNIPSPPDLLSTHSFKSLVKNLRSMYNYVILDAPPLTPFVDAAIIGSVVDGTILCVREHRTKRKMAETSVAQLKAANAHVLGCVMTFTTAETSDYYYAYYTSDGKRVRGGARGGASAGAKGAPVRGWRPGVAGASCPASAPAAAESSWRERVGAGLWGDTSANAAANATDNSPARTPFSAIMFTAASTNGNTANGFGAGGAIANARAAIGRRLNNAQPDVSAGSSNDFAHTSQPAYTAEHPPFGEAPSPFDAENGAAAYAETSVTGGAEPQINAFDGEGFDVLEPAPEAFEQLRSAAGVGGACPTNGTGAAAGGAPAAGGAACGAAATAATAATAADTAVAATTATTGGAAARKSAGEVVGAREASAPIAHAVQGIAVVAALEPEMPTPAAGPSPKSQVNGHIAPYATTVKRQQSMVSAADLPAPAAGSATERRASRNNAGALRRASWMLAGALSNAAENARKRK